MKLTHGVRRIEIEQLYNIRNLVIDLTDPSGNLTSPFVIAGPNAVGKTSVLNLIFTAVRRCGSLSDRDARYRIEFEADGVRRIATHEEPRDDVPLSIPYMTSVTHGPIRHTPGQAAGATLLKFCREFLGDNRARINQRERLEVRPFSHDLDYWTDLPGSGLSRALDMAYNRTVASGPCAYLIDTPELGLDPQLHAPLIRALGRTFPTTQFILTTHSAEVYREALSYQRATLLPSGDPRIQA